MWGKKLIYGKLMEVLMDFNISMDFNIRNVYCQIYSFLWKEWIKVHKNKKKDHQHLNHCVVIVSASDFSLIIYKKGGFEQWTTEATNFTSLSHDLTLPRRAYEVRKCLYYNVMNKLLRVVRKKTKHSSLRWISINKPFNEITKCLCSQFR